MKYKVRDGCQVVHMKEDKTYGSGEELEVADPHDVDRPHYLIQITEKPEPTLKKAKKKAKKKLEEDKDGN